MAAFPPPKRPPAAHPVDVGVRSETAVLAALVRLGYDVLVPHGTNHRYDLVVDTGDGFVRIQCKTGVHRGGRLIFRSQSVRSNARRASTRTYLGEVDFFAVHSPPTGRVFMVPCDETTRGHTTLRFDPPANGQVKRIRWAADHELVLPPEEPERGIEPLRSRLQIGCSTT
jgi:hypothetical protein